MSTTISSSQLDIQEIKESLKNFLKETGEFNDYDFEGSGLSNILDVLAYNTHLNALNVNFALNESFLSTAQLRPSVVSLAESIGYIPGSKTSAQSTIALTINLSGLTGFEETYTIQPGELILRGTMDDIDYTFTNRESITAVSNDGVYSFYPTADPEQPIKVFEGEERNQNFLVNVAQDVVYVIPDEEIDINTAIVKVFNNQNSAVVDGGAGFNIYTNLIDATLIDANSRIYVLRESPNRYYELTFGNGNTLGIAPKAGEVINVNYLRTNGEVANGIQTLTVSSSISLGGTVIDPSNVSLTVLSKSAGGGERESIESVRLNAPFQYSTQNRMVTATDYSSLILKKYSAFIDDIKSWGGEDDPRPDYGTVFTSIVWKSGLTNSTITNIRSNIVDLADKFSIASFNLKYQDPIETGVSVQTFFQFNPALTGFTESTIRSNVEQSISQYFTENTGKFDQIFRLSNMLTRVDATDESVLSSRADIILSTKLFPVLNISTNYAGQFPAALRAPQESTEKSVYSSIFIYKNTSSFIRNKLDGRVKISQEGVTPIVYSSGPTTTLELVATSGKVLSDNIGYYVPATGEFLITGLEVQSIVGNKNFIKLFAYPANQSVVNAELNNIIKYDPDESFTKSVIVSTN